MHRLLPTSLALLLGLSGSLWAATPGASVQGYARGDFVIGCTTCPHFVIPMGGEPEQSSSGAHSAEIDYIGLGQYAPEFMLYSLAGGAAYRGFAGFEGQLATPWLRANAVTDNEQSYILADPLQLPVGIDLYSASVQAATQMQYRYLGSEAGSYTFHFSVDGLVSNELSSVFAWAGLYASDATDFETGLIDAGFASFTGSGINAPATPFAGGFSISLTVQPGDSFWLLARLSLLADMTYSSADVYVSAWDTMRVSAIDGDLSLLQAAPVPEPAGALLLSLGLLAVGLSKAAARPRDGS